MPGGGTGSPSTGVDGSQFPSAKATAASTPPCCLLPAPLPALARQDPCLEKWLSVLWAPGAHGLFTWAQTQERLPDSSSCTESLRHVPHHRRFTASLLFIQTSRLSIDLAQAESKPGGTEVTELFSPNHLRLRVILSCILYNFPVGKRQAGQCELETAACLGSPDKPWVAKTCRSMLTRRAADTGFLKPVLYLTPA